MHAAARKRGTGGRGQIQRIFGYRCLLIQSNPMCLGLVLMDIHIQTVSVQLNSEWVKSICTLDDPNPLPGLGTTIRNGTDLLLSLNKLISKVILSQHFLCLIKL